MNDPSPLGAMFFAALEKGSADERAAYLGESCARDHELRRRIEKMSIAQAHGRQVVARFEAERQALAIMDHSNIAREFHGGATPWGRQVTK